MSDAIGQVDSKYFDEWGFGENPLEGLVGSIQKDAAALVMNEITSTLAIYFNDEKPGTLVVHAFPDCDILYEMSGDDVIGTLCGIIDGHPEGAKETEGWIKFLRQAAYKMEEGLEKSQKKWLEIHGEKWKKAKMRDGG